FELNEPVINLEVDKQGKPNWVFGPQAAAKPGEKAAGGAPQGTVKLGDVRLINGKLNYANLQTGDKQVLEQINAKVSLPSMDSPFNLAGSAVWNKEKVDLTAATGPLSKLLAGERSNVQAKLASKHLTLDFKGNAQVKGDATAAQGDVALESPSIKDLAAWTGKPLQDVKPNTMGKLAIKGKLALAGKKVDFTDAKILVDAIDATGALSVDATRAKPAVKGKLDVVSLDLNPYLGPEPPQQQAQDWSDAPIDLSALKTFDAELALSAGQVIYRKIKTGKATLAVVVKDSRASIDAAIPKPGLYQGDGSLQVVANAATQPASYDIKGKLAGIQAEPYLKDAQDMDKLSGTLGADLAITGRGQSQKQIMPTLNGNGAFKFADGAIKGIDLAGIARQLGEVGKGGATFDPSRLMSGFRNLFGGGGAAEKTDFTELGGTFTIANGIVTNKDLAMKSPFARVSGAGTIALPPKTMDYKLQIAAVSTIEGQGGKDQGGVGIPVNCRGPWTGDSCKPDLAGMFMGDPSKLLKSLPGLGGGLPGVGGAGGALPGVGKALPGGLPIPGAGGTGAPTGGAAAPTAPTGGGLLQSIPGMKKP
ncbi:MAG: AsmA family protein, partial [Alphaproteobacteria bacterium]|nr:AsmA family protein [Alphaproteobacteria bacterium]